MCYVLISMVLLPLILVGLPLAGLVLRNIPPGPYLEFPPLTGYVEHASFSWPVFILLSLVILTVLLPLFRRYFRTMGQKPEILLCRQSLPWWGYGGLVLVLTAWLLAWTRSEWFAPLQAYTFFPLWLGYIISVNGLTCSRTGSCLLADHSRFFLALFPASTVFWWFFEYLNRFVQNWHYLGVENFSPAEYIIHASLCFSTVLPAVLSTTEFLASFPRLAEPLKRWQPLHLHRPRLWGSLLLILAAGALGGISIFPDYLFPMLWVAPLLIITSVQAICRERTLLNRLAVGDWRLIWLPALAALTCGFFWEMWNVNSLAHWEYSVPFVQRFHLFEMPILGYGGYLPFGLECLVVGMMLDQILGTEVYRKK